MRLRPHWFFHENVEYEAVDEACEDDEKGHDVTVDRKCHLMIYRQPAVVRGVGGVGDVRMRRGIGGERDGGRDVVGVRRGGIGGGGICDGG